MVEPHIVASFSESDNELDSCGSSMVFGVGFRQIALSKEQVGLGFR